MSKKEQRSIRFAEGTRQDPTFNSQNSSTYKEALSQPAPNMSHKEKMLWLQKRRSLGLWVQCDECGIWRHLPHVLDSKELPEKWYCRMNPDPSKSTCKLNETPLKPRDEEDLIHSEYSAGSVVWARLDGWPWWPAMVDDCVDTEQFYWLDGFSDIPTHYNVVFFDSTEVTRSWISPENLKPYNDTTKNTFKYLLEKNKKNKRRIQAAIAQADDAKLLPLSARLEKYSFVAQFRGPIKSPKKATKETLLKIQKKLQKKYNVTFPIESSSDSEEGYYSPSDEAETTKTNSTIVETHGTRNATPKNSTPSEENEVIDTNFTIDTQKSSFTLGKRNGKKKFVIDSEALEYQETPKRPRLDKEIRIEDSLMDINSQSTIVLTQNVEENKECDSLVAQQGSTNVPKEDDTLIIEMHNASELRSSEYDKMETISTRIQRMESPTGSEDFEFE